MVRSRIPAVLIAGGVLLFGVYAAAWGALVKQARAEAEQEAEVVSADAVHYRVTDKNGDQHLLALNGGDPGQVLVEVAAKFGEGVQVDRITPREAAVMEGQAGGVAPVTLYGLVLILPLGLLLGGLRLRAGEARLQKLWNLLSPSLAMDLAELQHGTRLSPESIRRELTRLNDRGLAEFRLDAERNRVYDARLSAFSLTLQFCPQCNEPTNARMLADLNSVPTCPACMNPYDRRFLDQQKAEVVRQLVQESAARAQQTPVDADFSVGIFAGLAVVFPPAALAYALRRAS